MEIKKIKKIVRTPLLVFFTFVFGALNSTVTATTFPLGGIGGKAVEQVESGNMMRLTEVKDGAPGALAGLKVGDYIYGVNGKQFSAWGSQYGDHWRGPTSELGYAIDAAQGNGGTVSLMVLRSGTGAVTVNVTLPNLGEVGHAFPQHSAYGNLIYEQACADIHRYVSGSHGAQGYNTGWFGLCLLSHPEWQSTSGDKPYRVSLDLLRDYAAYFFWYKTPYDPASNNGRGSQGDLWWGPQMLMFLSEYRVKAGNISLTITEKEGAGNPDVVVTLDQVIQRGAEIMRNLIQDGKSAYQVGPWAGFTDENGNHVWGGHTGHGGHVGEYADSNAPWMQTGTLNATASLVLPGLSWAQRAGADFSATQTTALAGNWTIQDKWNRCWEWMKYCVEENTVGEKGNIGYMGAQGGGWDSAMRTAGPFAAFKMHSIESANPTAHDLAKTALMEAYLTKWWTRQQLAHAYTSGGYTNNQLAVPYFKERNQNYFRENSRFLYSMMRNPDGSIEYFGGRGNNGGDGYVGYSQTAWIYAAFPTALRNGGLPTMPPVNTARNYLKTVSPVTIWPDVSARAAEIKSLSQAFDVDLLDYQGNLVASGYTATWSQIAAPAGQSVTFTNANSIDTTANFSAEGDYKLRLTVDKGGKVITEDYDIKVNIPKQPIPGYIRGHVNYHIYTGISGTNVTDLTNAAKFPNSPDSEGTLTSLEGTYSGNNFGQRITGFIIPPTTGSYTFYIASDDTSQLRLNTSGADPAGASVICSVSSWTNKYQWTKQASQTSSSVSLTAGQPYFFEVLQKESVRGDHVAVGWTGPGILTTTVIPPTSLAVKNIVKIEREPTALSLDMGGSGSLSVRVSGVGPFAYEWFQDSVSRGASTSSTLSISNASAGVGGSYYCVITHPAGKLVSNTVEVTVNGVGQLGSGGLWRDQFDLVRGGSVTDLTGHSSYPKYPTSSGVVTHAESGLELGSEYGARFTGWITPDVTGDHYFYITSDDSSELWLSTDDQPVNKVKLASVGRYIGFRAWSSAGKSTAISLVANKRYYIEILHKESGGGDHCSVAWQKPGEAVPTNGSAPIASKYLEYFTGGVLSSSVTMPPTFDSKGYAWSLDENSAVSTVLGSVSATDPNGSNPLVYAIVSGNLNGAFTIDASSGQISVAGAIDYERISSYSLTVSATNSAGLVGLGSVAVTVKNIVGPADDSDSDGLQDDWEFTHFGNTTSQSALTDADNDGLSNGNEYLLGTKPNVNDSDGDGFKDGLEFAVGTGANDSQSTPGAEYAHLHAWWRLNESSGTLALDSSGNGRNATFVDSPTWGAGHLEGALSLDGSNDALKVGSSASITGTGGFTLSAWIKTTSTASSMIIQQRDTTSQGHNGQYVLRTNANGTVGFEIYNNASQFNLNTTTVINDGSWHHISAVRNGANGYIYIDGVLSAQATGPIKALIAHEVAIGYNLRDGINYFAGSLDDVRIYSAALDAAQIGTLAGAKTNVSPVITDASFVVAENASNGTSLGTVPATDANVGDSLSFSITSGNKNGILAINSSTGEITVAGNIDYEATPTYTLIVLVIDQRGGYDFAKITVNVTDVANDDSDADGLDDAWESTHFGNTTSHDGTGDPDNDQLNNAAEFIAKTNPNAVDSDLDGYSDKFELDKGSEPVNKDSVPSTILAGFWDFNNKAVTTETKDRVGAVNGVFNSGAVYTADAGGRSGLAGDSGMSFGSKAAGQRINVADVAFLNRATADDKMTISYWIKTSSLGNTAFWAVSPTSNSSQRGLQSHTPWTNNRIYYDMGGEATGHRIDAVASSVTWANWTHVALVKNVGTAEIWVNGNKLRTLTGMAALKTDMTSLVIGASSSNAHSVIGLMDDFAVFNVALTPLQITKLAAGASPMNIYTNQDPVAVDATFNLAENAVVSSVVGTVGATDLGDTLTYAITAGNTGGKFAINSNTGEITTVAPLDFETTSQYVLTVTATDTGASSDTATITINVTDVANDDSDADGLIDEWEMANYGVTNNVIGTSDTDGDGYTAFQEMVFGMNPKVHDAGSSAPVRSQIMGDKFEVKFRRPQNFNSLNVTYKLQHCNDLSAASWVDESVITPVITKDGANEWVTYLMPLPSGVETRAFYRCLVTPNK